MKYLIFALLISAVPSIIFPGRITITGTVTDATSGLPIAGASIIAKGENVSTLSATDGSFSMSVSDKTTELIISYVGYSTQSVKLKKNEKDIQINLRPAPATQKDEVAVTLGSSPDRRGAPTVELSGKVAGISVTRHHRRARQLPDQEFNTEDYDNITENRFLETSVNPLSTFSIDVDGASYSNARRFLEAGQLPPAGAVRIEEFINYFHYDYPQPKNNHPFSINTEIADCPWNSSHRLLMIGLQGRKIPVEKLPSSNLVFLIDVSGSMMDENKLPLVKSSIRLLIEQLREEDRVSMVVYAGNAGLVLPSTSGANKQKIRDAVDALEAGGSTAGGAGIKLAYEVARNNFMKEGNNRVILCTDGDFNVGVSSDDELVRIIEKERQSGVFLTVLGYGMGNYKDNKMQKLANKGNGNHAYIDNISEARKVLVNEFGGTLFTIAKDVKLQLEFNPSKVQAYRLVGYENRLLNKEDFNNDKKDAGEIGSGHTVTALYEIIPVGVSSPFIEKTDALKYRKNSEMNIASNHNNELVTIKFRYKAPDALSSRLIEHPVIDTHLDHQNTSANFRFVSAVAQFGMLLTGSEFRQGSSFEGIRTLASGALGNDSEGYRAEFLGLVRKAKELYKDEGVSRK